MNGKSESLSHAEAMDVVCDLLRDNPAITPQEGDRSASVIAGDQAALFLQRQLCCHPVHGSRPIELLVIGGATPQPPNSSEDRQIMRGWAVYWRYREGSEGREGRGCWRVTNGATLLATLKGALDDLDSMREQALQTTRAEIARLETIRDKLLAGAS